MKVPDSQARCDFEGIPSYGFSNDAKAAFRAPSFSAASFVYDGETLDLTITLRY